jgi:hypothetical protein
MTATRQAVGRANYVLRRSAIHVPSQLVINIGRRDVSWGTTREESMKCIQNFNRKASRGWDCFGNLGLNVGECKACVTDNLVCQTSFVRATAVWSQRTLRAWYCRVGWGKRDRARPLCRRMGRWDSSIETCVAEMGWEVVDRARQVPGWDGWKRSWVFGLCELRGVLWLAEELLASQGLRCMLLHFRTQPCYGLGKTRQA